LKNDTSPVPVPSPSVDEISGMEHHIMEERRNHSSLCLTVLPVSLSSEIQRETLFNQKKV